MAEEKHNPQVGEVWGIYSSHGGEHYVMITRVSGEIVRGAYVSFNTHHLSTGDVYVPEEESPAPRSMIVCTWLEFPIDTRTLREREGKMNKQVTNAVLMLLQNALTGDFSIDIHEGWLRGWSPTGMIWFRRAILTDTHPDFPDRKTLCFLGQKNPCAETQALAMVARQELERMTEPMVHPDCRF